MTAEQPGSGSTGRFPGVETAAGVNLEEIRRRNPIAVAMDALYLFTTAFFGIFLVKGFWPTVIAGVPLAALLYFGWRSSRAFFGAQVLAIGIAAAGSHAGAIPL